MRLFTAVDPPAEVLDNLERILISLRPTARLRWSPVENLHLTLKFIGEWPESRLDQLRHALAGLQATARFSVQVTGLGFFPNARTPQVFWAGIAPSAELKALAGRVDEAVEPLGIPHEKRLYSPHLTLARIGHRQPVGALRQAIDGLASVEFGAFTPDCFYLYESRKGPGGSTYARVGEFRNFV